MLFSRIETHDPDTIALREGARTVTYGMLSQLIDDYSRRLQSVDVLGIALDNGIEWLLWDLAALKSATICVPIPPFFSPAQINHTIEHAGITHMIGDNGLIETGTTKSKTIPEGTAKITFTSGTTGTPKGVCLPVRAMENVARSVHDRLGDGLVKTHCCTLPLAVLLENVAGVYAGLMAGCTIAVPSLRDFGPQHRNLRAVLQKTDANSVILVPELLRMLMAQIAQSGPLSGLDFVAVGGSRIAPALVETARQMGLPVYEGYGLSECGSVVSMNAPDHDHPGTSGALLGHVDAIIHEGEIIIENPGFLGYVEAPHSGPFATGDLGQIDDSGAIRVTGRRKNVLITSMGRNVSPEWPESALLAQPAIAQVIVHGDGDASLGALIVPSSPTADIAKAVTTVNRELPDYARIMHFKTVEPFTLENGLLTGTGRPRRATILQRHAAILSYRTPSQESPMNFYDRLVAETADARAELYCVPQLVDALQGRISRSTYVAYLTQAYHHVKHTVPFLMAMGSRLPDSKRWLHKAIIEYLEEEEGHEEWILNDIAAAGGDREAARRATPSLETQVMVAYNYDYISRKNPAGFLGMVFMLESTSTQIATQGAEAVMTGLELPKNAFSYLFSHGTLDLEHMKFFEQTVNQITDPADQDAIVEVANNTFRLFARLFAAIPHEREVQNVA